MYWEGSCNEFYWEKCLFKSPPSSKLTPQALVILYDAMTLIFGELILNFLHSLNKIYSGLNILKGIYQILLFLNIGGFPAFTTELNVLNF